MRGAASSAPSAGLSHTHIQKSCVRLLEVDRHNSAGLGVKLLAAKVDLEPYTQDSRPEARPKYEQKFFLSTPVQAHMTMSLQTHEAFGPLCVQRKLQESEPKT